jgi:hypothetical protein
LKEPDFALMNDARLIHATEQVVMPVLRKLLEDKLNEATGLVRSGKYDFIAQIAYVTAIQDVMTRLERMKNKGTKMILDNQEGI